ncbi:MAG TPA: DUF2490 domain-containing protein [Crenotrichaceae bacterium]|nr:DUF2490 domain-containing protein [Crenotrichaceae bacterium]
MKTISNTIILSLLLCATPLTCFAGGLNDMFGVWGSLTLQGDFSAISPELDKFHWRITNQTRSRDDDHTQTRFTENILFTQAGYQINEHASVWLGYVHNWIDPLHKSSFQESRPYQDFVWKQRFNDYKFMMRIRMDERIHTNTGDAGYRLRQLIQVGHAVPFIDNLSSYIGYEVLFYLNNSGFGRSGVAENRVYTGLNYQLTKAAGVSIGYMGQHVDRRGANDLFTHNIQIDMHYRFF